MAIQFKDYYETLGVSKSASQDEIKKAFRKLARKHHPDVSKDKAAAETKFKEINEAYEVLGDPDKRKRYDTLGSDWERGAPPPGPQQGGASYGGGFSGGQEAEFHFGGTGFSDFFEEFFGSRGRSFGGGGFARGREYPQAGQDIEADFMVTLEEALKGGRRKISFQRSNRAKPETYEVRIPPGVHEGQRIRLAGQGEAGSSGGTAGDLYLCVKLAQHPDFRVEGGDLVFELQVPVWQAVIGAECAVPTLEGSVRLKVPAGTQNHQRFRLKQRGLPRLGGGRGDLYVAIDVLLPKTLSKQERALWEQIAAESKPISQP